MGPLEYSIWTQTANCINLVNLGISRTTENANMAGFDYRTSHTGRMDLRRTIESEMINTRGP